MSGLVSEVQPERGDGILRRLWDLESPGSPPHVLPDSVKHGGFIDGCGMCFSPASRLLVTAHVSEWACLWDIASFPQQPPAPRIVRGAYSDSSVADPHAAFSSDGSILALWGNRRFSIQVMLDVRSLCGARTVAWQRS